MKRYRIRKLTVTWSKVQARLSFSTGQEPRMKLHNLKIQPQIKLMKHEKKTCFVQLLVSVEVEKRKIEPRKVINGTEKSKVITSFRNQNSLFPNISI